MALFGKKDDQENPDAPAGGEPAVPATDVPAEDSVGAPASGGADSLAPMGGADPASDPVAPVADPVVGGGDSTAPALASDPVAPIADAPASEPTLNEVMAILKRIEDSLLRVESKLGS